MATITISGLPEINTILDYTNIPVETVGITQRITGANLKSYLAALPALSANSATIAGALTAGSLTVNGAGTINGVLAATSITATTGSITGNLTVNNLAVTGASSFSGNVDAPNFNASATVHAVSLYGAIATPSQPAITTIGTLTNLTVTSPIAGSVTGSAATVTGAAQTNITSVGSLTGLTVNGTATVTTLNAGTVSVATLSPTTLSATTVNATNYTMSSTFLPTSNGTLNLGGPSNYFATIYGQATTARYADLAEMYVADATYEPGTVLCFGTTSEVTIAVGASNTKVAGVMSTQPAHLMNAGLTADYVAAVGLQGRVPCKVVGSISRGDMLTTSDIPGVATVATNPVLGSIIGKALENYSSAAVGVIEIVVGRL
jgi:cytoskeletal protein CcmA (bactofilin family)